MGAVFMIQCPVMTALLPGGYILQRSVKLLYSGYSSRIGQPEDAPHDIILDNLRSPQEKGAFSTDRTLQWYRDLH